MYLEFGVFLDGYYVKLDCIFIIFVDEVFDEGDVFLICWNLGVEVVDVVSEGVGIIVFWVFGWFLIKKFNVMFFIEFFFVNKFFRFDGGIFLV